ncbi:hypothetical protein [Myxosarcina sp. GI1(2024)]
MNKVTVAEDTLWFVTRSEIATAVLTMISLFSFNNSILDRLQNSHDYLTY